MDISELLSQRKLTRAIAALLAKEIEGHLQTITPLLSPRRVFAEQIQGGPRAASQSGPKALSHLRAHYAEVHNSVPFDLRRDFDTPLTLLDATPELQPLSYRYVARSGDQEKAVWVSRPLEWVLSFRGFGLSRLREQLAGNKGADGPSLQDTVLHDLMLVSALEMQPGIGALLEALRFPLQIVTLDEFGKLPLPVIKSVLTTHRPDDRVIIDSTEVSGSNDFEEVVDADSLEGLQDLLREKIDAIIAA